MVGKALLEIGSRENRCNGGTQDIPLLRNTFQLIHPNVFQTNSLVAVKNSVENFFSIGGFAEVIPVNKKMIGYYKKLMRSECIKSYNTSIL